MAEDIDMSKSGPPQVIEETPQGPTSAADIPELRRLVSEFRKERKAKRRGELLARLGGFTEGLRGRDAYAVTQSRLPDYSDRYMTSQQKQEALAKLRKEREGMERYYYGKAQERAKSRANESAKNLDRETRRVLEIQRIRSGESKARATQGRLALKERIAQNNTDRKQLETPTDATKSSMSTMPEFDRRLNDNVNAYFRKNYDSLSRRHPDMTDAEIKEELKDPNYNPSLYDFTKTAAQEDANKRITYLIQSGAEDKDIAYAMGEASRKSDTAENELYAQLDADTQEKARESDERQAKKFDNITEANDEILGQVGPEMDDPESEREQARIEALVQDEYEPGLMYERSQRIGSREAKKVGDVDPESLEDIRYGTAQDIFDRQLAEQQEARRKAIAAGEAQPEEQEDNYLGIPGVKPPRNSGALAQLEKQQELIEKYPDAPPVQYLRSKLSESKEMQDYMKKNNISDFNIGLKEAIRDVRKKERQDKMDSRLAVRKKRAQERLRDVPGLDKVETNKTTAAVAGATQPADKTSLI